MPTTRGSKVEPGARAAIDSVAAGKSDMMVMSVLGFPSKSDAVALWHLLWYARDHGATVIFATEPKHE